MQVKPLGRTGLKVSALCLGTMTFGNQADEEVSFAIMDRAWEAGVFFFDTADVYPVPPRPESWGRTEEIVRSEEHTSELQSRQYLVCRLLLEKKKKQDNK